MPLTAWLTWLHACSSSPVRAAQLLRSVGSVERALELTPAELAAAGLSDQSIERLRRPDEAVLDQWRQWLTGPACALIPLDDPRYPRLLATLPDPPLALWVEGAEPQLLHAPQLAMVGSRHPTAGGLDNARRFAAHFSERGLTVTSGLAQGIDGESHRGAMRGCGGTIAVLGSGLDRIFPRSNRALAAEIADRGALVSEYPPGVAPRPGHFPKRNRIIAGLALGTLVVEATRRSGSLITARLACDYGRSVFAIPGSIHNPLARGCHKLIRAGATLVEDASDVLLELAPQLDLENAPTRDEDRDAQDRTDAAALLGDSSYRTLIESLGFEPVAIGQLIERTGLTAGELSSMLLILELEGLVEALPGGRYSRLAKRI